MRIITTGLVLLGLLGLAPVAHAEVNSNEFLASYKAASEKGQTYLRGYMIGLVTAYAYTNTALKSQGAAPFYCIPTGIDLGNEEVVGLMRQTIRKDPQIGRTPFGMALLVALTRRFPCKNKKADPPAP